MKNLENDSLHSKPLPPTPDKVKSIEAVRYSPSQSTSKVPTFLFIVFVVYVLHTNVLPSLTSYAHVPIP